MTFAEEVVRDALAAGLTREIAEILAEQVGKPNQAQARIDEVKRQASMLQLVGAPALLPAFTAARLSVEDAKAAVHAKLRRRSLRTSDIESLRADAAAGRLKRPAPVATAAPPPTLAEIAAEIYAKPRSTT